jgi:hypothetical protein
MLKIINLFKLYEPECDTYDECKRLIIKKYIYLIYKLQLLKPHYDSYNSFRKDLSPNLRLLGEIKDLKLEEYKIKFSGQRMITDYFKSSSRPSTRPSSQYNLEQHKEDIKQLKEQQRLEQEQHRKIIEERNKNISEVFTIPSRLLRSLTTSSKKYEILDSESKINKWNDKIKELISELTLYEPTSCKNLDECIDKITTIIDIIYSFIERPNTMVYDKLPIIEFRNDKYNIQKNKIYKSFLKDYKINLDDTDLQHPLYKQLNKDNKKILKTLQKIKLDDCKNTFLKEIKGGRLNKKNF